MVRSTMINGGFSGKCALVIVHFSGMRSVLAKRDNHTTKTQPDFVAGVTRYAKLDH
ncbi:hypothetical protein [Vibrio sp. T11.5]|uniref:hypothetical protein n=1 Tax=Vibrio sp. T11.5 TaxID=2998836 RepID=UPI0022CDB513|nr:hypothetical protein [Vibrio sp. T11.5]MDA0117429.1 hypothetical protein [Vibrio sp. T11.5]